MKFDIETNLTKMDLNFQQNPPQGKGFGGEFLSLLNNKLMQEPRQMLEDMECNLNFETVKMDKADVDFFLGIMGQNNIINYNQGQVTAADKPLEVSKNLLALIEKSYNENKPVRLDFDNNITLVMRFDKKGKILADFYPSDKVAEEYLRNNVPFLRQRFEDQSIPYKEINYHQPRKRKQKGDK